MEEQIGQEGRKAGRQEGHKAEVSEKVKGESEKLKNIVKHVAE